MPVIDGLGIGDVVTIAADGVWLEGLTIKNSKGFSAGILVSSSGNTIVGNHVTRCDEGIHLDHADRNIVRDNTCDDNQDNGIYVSYSNGNRIEGNTVENNAFGIDVVYSSDNVIADNDCRNNAEIDLYAEYIDDSLIEGNSVVTTTRTNKIDGIGLRYGDNVTIDGNYVGPHYYGIKLYESANCLVQDNVADGSGVNIRLDFNTHDTTLRNNTVMNGVDNVYLHSSAYRNTVEGNEVFNGREGIYVLESDNNVIRRNHAHDNTIGIRLLSAAGNLVAENLLHDNEVDISGDEELNTIRDNVFGYVPPWPTPTRKIRPVTPTPTARPTGSPSPTPYPGGFFGDIISRLLKLLFGDG